MPHATFVVVVYTILYIHAVQPARTRVYLCVREAYYHDAIQERPVFRNSENNGTYDNDNVDQGTTRVKSLTLCTVTYNTYFTRRHAIWKLIIDLNIKELDIKAGKEKTK